MRTVKGHRINWFAVVPQTGERIRRNSTMQDGDWGWDAVCSCGWDSKTGGAIAGRVVEMVNEHKDEATAPVEATAEPTAAETALAALTPKGREFMRMVGAREFDFFDNGIVEYSGNWGEGMADQYAYATGTARRSVPGIMSRLAQTGLWSLLDDTDGTWWELTALGAEVALLAAKK